MIATRQAVSLNRFSAILIKGEFTERQVKRMSNLVVKNVNVLGDSIIAAKDEDGNIWAGVTYFCKALGMSKNQRDAQVDKVKSDKTLSKGCGKFPAGVFDASNEAYALRLDFIPIWLAKISITDKMQSEHPGLADKLLNYQLKAKDVLAEAFLPKQSTMPQTTDGKIALLAQGHVELKAEIDSVKADLEQFKNEMPILGVEESKITAAVKKKGVECLGGKDSNAYNDKSLRQKLYSDLHRQLKREFGVSTYKAIKRNQTEAAVLIIQGYKPPLVLSETITYENAQQTLDM